MKFRFLYFFAAFLAAVLTFGCGGGSDPEPDLEPDPELTILVQPPGEGPFPGGVFVRGQNVTLTARVSHTGGSASEATQLQLYLSQDVAISTDDSPQGEMQPVEALMSGASADVNITVTLPSETGSYYYGACITPANSNENCSSGALIMVSEPTQMVELGSMTEANLTAGESGYFRLTLESAQSLAIYTSGTTDTAGRLYDARSMLLTIDDNGGDGNNFRIERLLDSGTYFIRVSGNDMSTAGGYTLNLEGSGVTTVMPGSMTEATLPAGGADYFQFTLTSAQLLVVYTSGTTNTAGGLYNAFGVLLATAEYDGARLNFLLGRPLTPGTYFIRVSGIFPNTAGDYTLHVEVSDITTATAIMVPSMAGESTESDKVSGTKFFQLQIETAQTLTITSNNRNFGVLRITIYDADFNILVNPGDSEDGSDFRTSREFTPGTYFLKVTGAPTVTYKVSISREADDG